MTNLTDALKKQVIELEKDLRPTGLADPKLRAEWEQARAAQRTAATFETWLADRVTQVAVAWVLGTVFVRFAEDNGLIEYPYIAGPGERTVQARELQQQYYEKHPGHDDYNWLREAFDAMSVSPVARSLFDESHNPMWTIKPSPFAVKALLDFWRQADEHGAIRYDLADETWDTR
ncbi:MAG TPA: SAM-dependent methyltransferase, partial [Trebonia sp.]